MHITIVSVRLYNMWIAQLILSGMVFTSTFGKKLQFILHMNKIIHHFHLAVQSQFQYILTHCGPVTQICVICDFCITTVKDI
jgi:hypothetical protein